MRSTLTVLVAAVSAGLLLTLLSALRRAPATPPERAEHWIVGWLAAHRLLGRLVRSVDRRAAGGIAVAAMFVVVVAAAVPVGWLFDSIESDRGVARWDRKVAEWGATNATETSTGVLSAFTQAGSTVLVCTASIAIGIVDRVRRARWVGLGFLTIVTVGIAMITNVLKLVVARERPLVAHLVSSSGYSFPSGHSATAAAFWAAAALVLAMSLPRRLRWVPTAAAGALTLLVAASRALLGVHWLTDVVAGVLVGWGWFFLVAIAFGGRVIALGQPASDLARTARTQRSANVTSSGHDRTQRAAESAP